MARRPGSAPIDKIPSTVVAIAVLLIGLPIAVGALTTGATSSTYDWENTYDPTSYTANYPAFWVENGQNNSLWYESNVAGEGHCSYLVPYEPPTVNGSSLYNPACYGYDASTDTLGSPGLGGFTFAPIDYYASAVHTYFTGSPAIYMPQSHEPMSNYQGTSGDGPFSIVFDDTMDHFPQLDEDVQAFRFRMVDPSVQYACDSSVFANVSFHMQLSIFDTTPWTGSGAYQDALVFDRYFEGMNKVEMEIYDFGTNHWDYGCWVGFDLVFEFDAFESLQLDQQVQDNYSNMRSWMRIDDIRVEGSQNVGSTALPFAGNEYFLIQYEFSTVNEQEVNFALKGGTLILSVITFAVALGSTPYWDPVRAWFKGRI